MNKFAYILPILCAIAFAEDGKAFGTFTDSRDGKTYKTAKIGTQTWMSENLNYNASGSKCYDNKQANCEKYGRLYDWNTAKNVCPYDWHLPNDKELGVLMKDTALGKLLKAKSGWNDYKGESGNGTDEYGFSALPGGTGYSDGYFFGVGNISNWWTSSEYDSSFAYIWGVSYINEYAYQNEVSKSRLHSVRCLYEVNTFVDSRDGNMYYFVKIGKQTWMAENLNYNASGSRCYDDEPAKCEEYGRLYDWKTAKKACPKGWHLPSDKEWDILEKSVSPVCSSKDYCDYCVGTGKLLKAKNGWRDDNAFIRNCRKVSGNGTDAYGFSALPGGEGIYSKIEFYGGSGYWWSSSEYNSNRAYARKIEYYDDYFSRISNYKYSLFSVRCLQD